jgi:hypothetical protein
MAAPGLRLREIQFLAGNVLKWHLLYNQLPDASSAIYWWFPDSDTWSTCIAERGFYCFDDLTTPHADSVEVS